jgi:hypothetical protein
MRYLLIGNAPDQAEAVSKAAERADIVLQIDHCRYAEILPRVRANYVFLTNAGATAEVWSPIMNRLLSLPNASVFQHDTRLILARNPAFYAVKKSLMRARLRTQSAHQIMTAAKATEDAKLRDNLS